MNEGIIINTGGGTVITGGNFENVEFVANKYVVNEPKRTPVADIVEVEDVEKQSTHPTDIPESATSCFKFANDFIKGEVEKVVKAFYLDKAVNLALIEVVLFDHGQLYKRNGHAQFVRALLDWGILCEGVDVSKTSCGMASKLRKPFPTTGYKDWDNTYLNERNLCVEIAKKLDETIKYNR